jgi:hypothetical protein
MAGDVAAVTAAVRPWAGVHDVTAVGPGHTASGLPPGTRVRLREGARLAGMVMSYERGCSPDLLGLFPVRLDNGIWQTCHASDVIVLAPADAGPSVRAAHTDSGT